jgi:hypothetical protein
MKGLLWFDNSDRPLSEKAAQAAARYREKFGHYPTICLVPADALDGQPQEVNGVQLKGASNVLRHHFLVGVDGDGQQTDGQ